MKTKPIGVRFDNNQLKFLQEREKLSTPQAAINFLLQDYWIRNNIIPEISEAQNQIAAINETEREGMVIKLNEYQKEHDSLGDSLLAKQRKRWLGKQISNLKQRL